MRKIAIVTGASSGLGVEFVKQIDERYELEEIWLIARREEKLQEVANSVKNASGKVLPLDLSKADAIDKIVEELEKGEDYQVQILVNNAGFGFFGDFKEANWTKYDNMLAVNVKAVMEASYKLIPFIDTAESPAGIINVASSAGFQPSAKYNVYAATKAFVLDFSVGLYSEYKAKNLRVLAVCPGPVKTEFFDVASEGDKTFSLKDLAAPPQAVVQKALDNFENPAKAVSIYGPLVKAFLTISRILPKKWVARFG